MKISLVISILSVGAFMEWKCASTPVSLMKTYNSSEPSLVKTSNSSQSSSVKMFNSSEPSLVKTSNSSQSNLVKGFNSTEHSLVKISNSSTPSLVKASNSSKPSLVQGSNSSEPSLEKAMEGGPVQINGVYEEEKETKGKITARKSVKDISPPTLSQGISQKRVLNREGKVEGKVAATSQGTLSNRTNQPLLKSTTAYNLTTNSLISTPSSVKKKPATELTTVKRKKKPLFTMIGGDELLKDAESFIESPTTGRDYVLSIVLFILLLPAVIFMIKLIYKRGTEFTERQQYHRMYLIDGMYNTR